MLRISIAERHRELGGPTTTAVWIWVGSYRLRFMSLARRVLAGEVARVRPFRPAASRPPPSPPPETKVRLPTKRAWLCVMVPCRAACSGAGLAQMLRTDAEFMALVASDPRFGRLLRPLLWATGQRQVPPCVPAPVPRRRAARPATVTAGRGKPARAPRPVRPVTGRALQKYLPWKKPRPLPPLKTHGAGGGTGAADAAAKTKA